MNKRFLPIHILAKSIGYQLCSVLPALHHLAGADYTSKVGTKHSAIQVQPEKFLGNFAHGISKLEIECSVMSAEKYLLQVFKKNNTCKTFDEFRYWTYHFGNIVSITDLPPTSNSIRLHILRAFYATYEQINVLKVDSPKLNPQDFGYDVSKGCLIPAKENQLFPPIDEFIPNCTCKKCSTKLCSCKAAGLSCTSFCICQANNTCSNPYNLKHVQ